MRHLLKFAIMILASLCICALPIFASDYEISGSFTAYNNGFETSIKIMQRDETVSEITLDPAGEKGKNTETFSISVPSGGEYDLVISKPGALSYKITGITVNGNIDLTASGDPEISSPELIPGDITGDGFIDSVDVSQIAFDMGKSPAQATYPASDLNGDGFRDALDVSLIAFNLLKTAQSAEYPSQTKKLQLCTFDEVGALTTNIGSNLEASGEVMREGSASVKMIDPVYSAPYYLYLVAGNLGGMNAVEYINGQIHVSVYLGKASAAPVSSLELYDADGKPACWYYFLSSTQDGWVDYTLDISAATDTIAYSSLSSFRFFVYTTEEMDVYIDDLYLEAMGGSQQESSTTLHTFDSAQNGVWWGTQGMQWSSFGQNEGDGWLSNQTDSAASSIICGNIHAEKPGAATVPDLPDYPIESAAYTDITKEAYMQIDLYVSDESKVGSLEIYMSSCRNGPVATHTAKWLPDTSKLKDGWNTLTLRLNGAETGASFDPEKVQYINFTLNTNGACSWGVDNWRGVTGGDIPMYDIIEGLNFSFDFDQYMTPIWSGDTVYNETVNFLTIEDKAPLLYPISEIISVKSFDLKTTYTQGVDYDVEDGKIVLLEGTSIPYMTREYYYGDTSNTVLTMDGDVERSTAFGATATYQVVVTYKHTQEWNRHEVKCKSECFESFINKLECGKDVTVLFFGDSIMFGAAASVVSFGEPKMPPWNELVVLYLAQKYGYTVHYHPLSVVGAREIAEKEIVLGKNGTIHLLNSGVPGWTGEGAVTNFNTHIKELRDQYGCDLLVLGFGMNDGDYTVEKEKEVFTQLLNKVFEMDASLPVLQVATMVPNIDSTNWYKNQHLFEDVYIDVCEDFAEQGKSCAVATMTSLSLSICDSKRYRDFSDNICHPTDFVMRAYAHTVIQTLIGYGE